MSLKWQFTPKRRFCHRLFTRYIKTKIFEECWGTNNIGPHLLSLYGQSKKVCHIGLKRHKVSKLMTEFSFQGDLYL